MKLVELTWRALHQMQGSTEEEAVCLNLTPRPSSFSSSQDMTNRRKAKMQKEPQQRRPLYRGPPVLPPQSSREEMLNILRQRERDLKDIRLSPQTLKSSRSTWDAYAVMCAFIGVPELPINRLALLHMVDNKCDDNDNATSAAQWVSHVYSFARYSWGSPIFSDEDSLHWNDIYPGLWKEYGRNKNSPPALGAKDLLKIYDITKPDPRKNLAEWINWTHILLAYHGTMRPNEHLGPECGATVSCFSLLDSGEGAEWRFTETKGTRMVHSSSGEKTYFRSVEGPLDVVAPLVRYIELFRLSEVPDHPLFPSVTAAGQLTNTYMSGNEFNTMIRNFTARAGITTDYTARCLRSGHRTDLRNSGVPPDIVNLLGRWKSESASLMYQRTTEAIVRWLPRSIGGRVF